jgi:hypothetical protein
MGNSPNQEVDLFPAIRMEAICLRRPCVGWLTSLIANAIFHSSWINIDRLRSAACETLLIIDI